MPTDPSQALQQPKSPLSAAFLNVLIAGVGNLYVGEEQRAFTMMGIAFVMRVIAVFSGGVGWILFVPYLIWAFIDGLRAGNEYNARIANAATQRQRAQEQAQQSATLSKVSAADLVAGMKKLHQLHEAQIITAEEFAKKKTTLIGDVQARGIRETAEDFLTSLIPLLQQGILTQSELAKIKLAVM